MKYTANILIALAAAATFTACGNAAVQAPDTSSAPVSSTISSAAASEIAQPLSAENPLAGAASMPKAKLPWRTPQFTGVWLRILLSTTGPNRFNDAPCRGQSFFTTHELCTH